MIHIDFETFSASDLTKVEPYKYSTDPSTEILCMAYSLDGEFIELWTPTNGHDLTELFTAIKEGQLLVAFNAYFEQCIWNNLARKHFGLNTPIPDLKQWRCSAAMSAVLNLPKSLGKVVEALESNQLKDSEGKRVMMQLSKPKKPSKKDPEERYTYQNYPDKFQTLYEYCMQDVRTEVALCKQIPELTESELTVWQLDQKINLTGVPIDLASVRNAIKLSEELQEDIKKQLSVLTDGEITTANQRARILSWCRAQGDKLSSLQADYLKNLDKSKLSKNTQTLLSLRDEAKNISVKKLEAFIRTADETDGRIRGSYKYHSASTGRWSSTRVQLHSLPRGDLNVLDNSKGDAHDQIIDIINNKTLQEVKDIAGTKTSVMGLISSSIRSFIKAPAGYRFISADYSSIEARVIAFICGNITMIKMYEEGIDLYKRQASSLYGVPEEEVTKEQRSFGKEVILACVFQQGAVSLLSRCQAMGLSVSKEMAEKAVKIFREENPAIRLAWYSADEAVKECIAFGKDVVFKGIRFSVKHKGYLTIRLLSGRLLYFSNPRLEEYDTPIGVRPCIVVDGSYVGSTGASYGSYKIFGGRIIQNIVQATARDILANALLNLDKAGYKIIMHSHDEIVTEIPNGVGSLDELQDIMCTLPAWAEGLPIKSEGWEGIRYRK